MAEKLNNKKKLLPKPPQKPSYQVWIIAALLFLILGITVFNKSTSTIEITQKRFESMLKAHDIRELTIIPNQNIVELTLKDEALDNEKYRDELSKKGPFALNQGPQYSFTIIKPEAFKEDLEKLQKGFSDEERVPYRIEPRSDLSSFIATWGVLILMFFGLWFLMRRMTGGAGPGGQIFNIGKSKAALFDAENKVKITFNDVAGLDEAKE
jgi:AFG3 family protein